MKTFYKYGVHGAIILDARRKKSNGMYPVKYRLTYQGKQIYINAGTDLSVKEWEMMPTTRKTYLVNIRQALTNGFTRLENDIDELCQNDEYSHEKIVIFIRKGKNQLISEAFENKIKELQDNGQPGTAGVYNNSKVFIKKSYPELKFADVTPHWLKKFEREAISGGLSYSTLSIYLRCLRVLFNDAIAQKMLKENHYPFTRSKRDKSHYQIKKGSGTKIALNAHQIKALAEYNPPTPAMRRSRDLFMLSFMLFGINFKDMLLLKWSNIHGSEITYTREKTRNNEEDPPMIRIPIGPVTKNLINTLGDPDSEYILPFMIADPSPADVRRITYNILRTTNRHLLAISKELDLPGLSTMVARHSVATITKNKGVPVAFIQEQLGHMSINTTANYLKKFETKEREQYFDMLTNILDNED